MDINIRICGAAGQGLQSVGDLLARGFAFMGAPVFATQTYLSRVRGGVNTFDIRLTGGGLQAPRDGAEILVAMNAESLAECREKAGGGAFMLLNSAEGGGDDGVIALDFEKTAKEAGGEARMANAVAAGAVFALLDCDTSALENVIGEMFDAKGSDVVEKNIKCAKKGSDICTPWRGKGGKLAGGGGAERQYVSGSDAIGLSAAVSGIKFASAYPMTPSTNVFTYLASVSDRYGILVEQAEDEIAALNMVCGAVYAGVPAMTCTSGGGLALMVEAVSLAAAAELPVLIYLSQRPGPATGLPTRTDQSDLKFAIHCGHGEFARAIFAPGTIAQAYELTRAALRTANKYQSPVFLVSDHFLAHAYTNAGGYPDEYDPVERFIEENPGDDYERYKITETGVSPRALPGGDVAVIADSHEHSPDGHMTEDPAMRVKMVDKRLSKLKGLKADFIAPEIYPQPAENILACWGSAYGPCREAVDILREGGGDFCMMHFPQVWPLDADVIRPLLQGRKVTVVEGNATAQFAYMLKAEGALGEYGAILRYDGFPFTAEYITGKVTS